MKCNGQKAAGLLFTIILIAAITLGWGTEAMGKYLTVDEQATYIDVVCDGFLFKFLLAQQATDRAMFIYDPTGSSQWGWIEEQVYQGGTDFNYARDPNRVYTVVENTPTRVIIKRDGIPSTSAPAYIDGADSWVQYYVFYSDRVFVHTEIVADSGGIAIDNSTTHNHVFMVEWRTSNNENNIVEDAGSEDNTVGTNQDVTADDWVGFTSDEMNIIQVVVDTDITGPDFLVLTGAADGQFTSRLNNGTLTEGTHTFTLCWILDSSRRTIEETPGTWNDWDTDIDTNAVTVGTICEQSADSLRYLCHTAHTAAAGNEPPDTDYWWEYRMTLGDQYKDLFFDEYHEDITFYDPLTASFSDATSPTIGSGTIIYEGSGANPGNSASGTNWANNTDDGIALTISDYFVGDYDSECKGSILFEYTPDFTGAPASHAYFIGDSTDGKFRWWILTSGNFAIKTSDQYVDTGVSYSWVNGVKTFVLLQWKVTDIGGGEQRIFRAITVNGIEQYSDTSDFTTSATLATTMYIGQKDSNDNESCLGTIKNFYITSDPNTPGRYAPMTGTVVRDSVIPKQLPYTYFNDGFASDGARHLEMASDEIKYTVDRARIGHVEVLEDPPIETGTVGAATDHLVGHWKMDDNAASTALIDETGNSSCTLGGGADTEDIDNSDAIRGTSLLLDGTDDYLIFLDSVSELSDDGIFSLSFRFKPNFNYDTAHAHGLFTMGNISSGDNIELFYFHTNDTFYLHGDSNVLGASGSNIETSAYTDNASLQRWYDVLVSINLTAEFALLQINGEIIGVSTWDGDWSGAVDRFNFGYTNEHSDYGSYYIDNVKLINGCLLPYGAYSTGNGAVDTDHAHSDITCFVKGDEANTDALKIGTGTMAVADVTYATDVFGNASSAVVINSGNDDFIIPSANLPSLPYSLSFWFKGSDTPSGYNMFFSLMDAYSEFSLYRNNNDASIVLRHNGQICGFSVSATVFDNNWHHILVRVAASAQSLEINGVVQDSTTTSLTAIDAPADIYLGNENGSYLLSGSYSDFYIINNPNTPQIPVILGSGPIHAPIRKIGYTYAEHGDGYQVQWANGRWVIVNDLLTTADVAQLAFEFVSYTSPGYISTTDNGTTIVVTTSEDVITFTIATENAFLKEDTPVRAVIRDDVCEWYVYDHRMYRWNHAAGTPAGMAGNDNAVINIGTNWDYYPLTAYEEANKTITEAQIKDLAMDDPDSDGFEGIEVTDLVIPDSTGTDGFAFDGGRHLEKENDELAYTVDIDRVGHIDIIEDPPIETGTVGSATDHLIGHWKMDDNAASTVVVDATSKVGDLIASANTNTLSVADAVRGTALQLDAVSSEYLYMSFPTTGDYDNENWQDELTFTIIFKPNFAYDIGSNQSLGSIYIGTGQYMDFYYDRIGEANRFRINYTNSGANYCYLSNPFSSDGELQQFHHAQIILNLTDFLITSVFNGEVIAIASAGATPWSGNIKLRIGRNRLSGYGSFIIDDVKLINGCLLPYGAYFTGNGNRSAETSGVLDMVDTDHAHNDILAYVNGHQANGENLDIGTGTVTISGATKTTDPWGNASGGFLFDSATEYIEFPCVDGVNINKDNINISLWYQATGTPADWCYLFHHTSSTTALGLYRRDDTQHVGLNINGTNIYEVDMTSDIFDGNLYFIEVGIIAADNSIIIKVNGVVDGSEIGVDSFSAPALASGNLRFGRATHETNSIMGMESDITITNNPNTPQIPVILGSGPIHAPIQGIE